MRIALYSHLMSGARARSQKAQPDSTRLIWQSWFHVLVFWHDGLHVSLFEGSKQSMP